MVSQRLLESLSVLVNPLQFAAGTLSRFKARTRDPTFEARDAPEIVTERLGHSTIALTQDTYSRVLPDIQKDMSRQIDASLRRAMDKVKEEETTDDRTICCKDSESARARNPKS